MITTVLYLYLVVQGKAGWDPSMVYVLMIFDGIFVIWITG